LTLNSSVLLISDVNSSHSTSYYSPFKFSAKEKDLETGYSYFGARYYSPELSVWLSIDPLADKAPGWTPYRYGFNNPISFVDPNGMFESEESASKAREKAIKQYGVERVTEVYFNEDKKEWGFGVSSEDNNTTVSKDENGLVVSSSQTTGVYNEDFLKDGGRVDAFGFSFAFGGGYSLRIGRVQDDKGGSSYFFSHGPKIGISLSLGYESTNVIPSPNSELGFSINQYVGESAGLSAGSGNLGGQWTGSHSYSRGSEAFKAIIPTDGYFEIGLSTNVLKGGFKFGLDWGNSSTMLIGRQ
jgi:RHS repeat-associated protein